MVIGGEREDTKGRPYFSGILLVGPTTLLPFPLPTTLPIPCRPLPSSQTPPLPLEVGLLNPVREFGERCKIPQRGQNQICCNLALKSDIWWHQF